MANYAAFSEDDGQRIARAVTRVEGVPAPARMRRRLPPRALGGGGETCPIVIEFAIYGAPTGGTVSIDWYLDSGSGLASDTITFSHDDDAASFLAAVEAHSEITASDDVAVFGGPLPFAGMYIVFKKSGAFGAATMDSEVYLPTLNTNSLTGGSNPYPVMLFKTGFTWPS